MDEDDIYGSILSDPKSVISSSGPRTSEQNSSSSISHTHNTSSNNSTSAFPPQCSIFISNLTWWTTEDQIRHSLGSDLSSRIKGLQFLEYKPNGKSKGMVIVEFVDLETAEVGKSILEGREIDGKVCEVSFAKSPPNKPYEKNVRFEYSKGDNYHHHQSNDHKRHDSSDNRRAPHSLSHNQRHNNANYKHSQQQQQEGQSRASHHSTGDRVSTTRQVYRDLSDDGGTPPHRHHRIEHSNSRHSRSRSPDRTSHSHKSSHSSHRH